jgi:hypothetical protein
MKNKLAVVALIAALVTGAAYAQTAQDYNVQGSSYLVLCNIKKFTQLWDRVFLV